MSIIVENLIGFLLVLVADYKPATVATSPFELVTGLAPIRGTVAAAVRIVVVIVVAAAVVAGAGAAAAGRA